MCADMIDIIDSYAACESTVFDVLPSQVRYGMS